jgi:hypothetical protein
MNEYGTAHMPISNEYIQGDLDKLASRYDSLVLLIIKELVCGKLARTAIQSLSNLLDFTALLLKMKINSPPISKTLC